MEYRILNHLPNPVGEEKEYGGEKVCTVTADIPLKIAQLAFCWRVELVYNSARSEIQNTSPASKKESI
jgi:hypothetical protein